jgi:type II secretory pathway component GspD/PulD (secretin)
MKTANRIAGGILGCVLLLGAGHVGAQQRTMERGATRAGAAAPDKKITFEMHDKPWTAEKSSVLEWLSDQTGLPVSISSAKPTGTLTFFSPRADGAAKQYSLPEVIDILNDELLKQKLILVRRAKTFTVEPADEKIDPAALPRVLPGELEQYGNTELVSVVFPLTSLVAEDFAAEVKGMLGPFGSVVPLSHVNKILVQDTVANLKGVRAIVKDSQESEKSQSASFSHTCRYLLARQAAKIVRHLLGDPRELLRVLQPQALSGNGTGGQSGAAIFDAPPMIADGSKLRMHYVSVDERTNTVLVTGPADKIAQAAAILKKIDVPQQKDQPPVQGGPGILKIYLVPGGNAEVVARNLQEIYKDVPEIRIAAVDNHRLMVWAGPNDQREIDAHLRRAREQNSLFEVLPLTTMEAADVVETLKGMFGSGTKAGAPYLKADTTRNAVIAKGTPDQLGEIKFALKALGEGGAPPPGESMRIITIEQGNAATLSIAESLERMLPQFLQNPVQVITPAGSGTKSPEPRKFESAPNKSPERPW